MTPLIGLALAGCFAVGAGSDRITVRDFAAAFPGLDGAVLDTVVGFAPAPGVQRIFRAPELRRLSLSINAPAPADMELCIERPVARLEPARVLEAMRRQLPDADIEIMDYSRLPAPQGELDFPVSGLRQAPGGGFWSGAVRYAGTRRFAVWARVKVLVPVSRVIVTADLQAGHPVAASQLRLEQTRDFPAAGAFVTSIEEAAGRVLRRPVSAGAALRSAWLDEFRDVARGDTVRVEVWSGRAHLELDGVAEGSGATGATIIVRNPDTKKRFSARVEGKGQVSVGKGTP